MKGTLMNLVLIVERRAPNGQKTFPMTCAILRTNGDWFRITDRGNGQFDKAFSLIDSKLDRYWLEGRSYT